jgi:hypothetical protein
MWIACRRRFTTEQKVTLRPKTRRVPRISFSRSICSTSSVFRLARHTKLLTDATLDVNDTVPSHPYDLRDRAGVVAIRFGGHRLRHAAKASRVDAE